MTGHHVVMHDADLDITVPGNTCMISIPSVWDAALAPPNHHVVHAYTLESFEGWRKDASYGDRKRNQAEPLFRALEKVIPDVRDRTVLELIGTAFCVAIKEPMVRRSPQARACFQDAVLPFQDSIAWVTAPCRVLAFRQSQHQAFSVPIHWSSPNRFNIF